MMDRVGVRPGSVEEGKIARTDRRTTRTAAGMRMRRPRENGDKRCARESTLSRDDYSMSLTEDTQLFVREAGSYGKEGEGGAGTGSGAHAHSGMHAKRAPYIRQKSPVRLEGALLTYAYPKLCAGCRYWGR